MSSILWTGWSQMFASAKLAKRQVRVKPEQAMAARNQDRRTENKQARAVRRGTQTHRPQRFQPPGADPHAGWCGRGAVNDDCPLCRLGAIEAIKSTLVGLIKNTNKIKYI